MRGRLRDGRPRRCRPSRPRPLRAATTRGAARRSTSRRARGRRRRRCATPPTRSGRALLRTACAGWPGRPLDGYRARSARTPRPVALGRRSARAAASTPRPRRAASASTTTPRPSPAAAVKLLAGRRRGGRPAGSSSSRREIEALARARRPRAATLPSTGARRCSTLRALAHAADQGGCLPPERERCASASAGRSAPARPRWSPRSAGALAGELALGVVTNDIYTDEDARFLRAHGRAAGRADRRRPDRLLPAHRDPRRHHREPRGGRASSTRRRVRSTSIFVESGGDNLTAAFSPALADVQIFVLDCAGGDDVPRKGGPGVARSRPARDQQDRPRAATSAPTSSGCSPTPRAARDGRPVLAISLRAQADVEQLAAWVTDGARGVSGRHAAQRDPGPMAPHHHRHDHDGHTHSHAH